MKTIVNIVFISPLALSLLGAGCNDDVAPPPPKPDLTVVSEDPGDQPLHGLSQENLARFRVGDGLFDIPFRPVDGLGPVYIRTSCSACHEGAGRGPGSVRKFQVVDTDGQPLADAPEMAFGNTVRPYAVGDGTMPVAEPGEVTAPHRLVTSVRVGPSVLGRGYIEAITDAEIERVAAEQAARADEIHGRINRVTYHSEASALALFGHALGDSNLIGRFGHKARVPTLDDFAADAFQGDMGLTSPLRPHEVKNPQGLLDDAKIGVDVTEENVAEVAQYARTLEIPRRDPAMVNGPGRALFERALCSACHVPSLRTRADHPIAQLADIDAPVFSDLLLHDMGNDLADELSDESAGPREWRTAPLIGVRFQRSFLHDGRAKTVADAIRMHAGTGSQANASVARFEELSVDEQKSLLALIEGL